MPIPALPGIDMCFTTEFFEHVHDPLPYFERIHGKLARGGLLVTGVMDHHAGFLHVSPQLHLLPSPYRFVIIPIVQFVLELAKKNPGRNIVVVIPELVEDRWYEYFLHNQRGRLLEWVLLARGNECIFTVSAPWYVGNKECR